MIIFDLFEDNNENPQGVTEGTLNELAGYSSNKAYQSVEAYKRYDVYVSRKKFNNIAFIAVAENPRTRDISFKTQGNTPQEAVDNLKAEIDREIDTATKVSGQGILDFNVDFVRTILELSSETFYAKIIPGPRLVIAGSEMLQYPDIMKSEGFKPSSIRTSNSTEGTTPLPGVSLSSKAAIDANLVANGRYVLGDETVDRDGNRVFDLNFDSVVQASNDKMRLRVPAVTVGTNRSPGVTEAEGPGRVDPILYKALARMTKGGYDDAKIALAIEFGLLDLKNNYAIANNYIPKLIDLYDQKNGIAEARKKKKKKASKSLGRYFFPGYGYYGGGESGEGGGDGGGGESVNRGMAEGSLTEMDRRGFLRGLAGLAASAAAPTPILKLLSTPAGISSLSTPAGVTALGMTAGLALLKGIKAQLDQYDAEDDDAYFEAWEDMAAELGFDSTDADGEYIDPLGDLINLYNENPKKAAQQLITHIQSEAVNPDDITSTFRPRDDWRQRAKLNDPEDDSEPYDYYASNTPEKNKIVIYTTDFDGNIMDTYIRDNRQSDPVEELKKFIRSDGSSSGSRFYKYTKYSATNGGKPVKIAHEKYIDPSKLSNALSPDQVQEKMYKMWDANIDPTVATVSTTPGALARTAAIAKAGIDKLSNLRNKTQPAPTVKDMGPIQQVKPAPALPAPTTEPELNLAPNLKQKVKTGVAESLEDYERYQYIVTLKSGKRIRFLCGEDCDVKTYIERKYKEPVVDIKDQGIVGEPPVELLPGEMKEVRRNTNEVSPEYIERYKKEHGRRATAADQAGDYAKGHEHFKKINKLTKQQFQRGNKSEKVDEISNFMTLAPKPVSPEEQWKRQIRLLAKQYQTNASSLAALARENGPDSAEAVAYEYLRNPSKIRVPGTAAPVSAVNWDDVIRRLPMGLSGMALLQAAEEYLINNRGMLRSTVRSLLNNDENQRTLSAAYAKKKTPAESVTEESDNEAVEQAIVRRIMVGRTDLLLKYGPKKVMQAVEDVADYVGSVDEIGSSDVSGWVRQVERVLSQ